MAELGRLERVDLREVWRHEERDFSAWLAQEENIELLAEELGIEIEMLQREAPVGGFHADLLAEEANTGRKIIIENQLEPTNHDHLGKLVTYAAGYDAAIIVWIVREVRDEHRRAVEWLNEHTDEETGFFLIQMEVWRIAESPPAPKFNVVVQPNDWAKAVKSAVSSGQLSETKLLQLDFWSSFNEVVSSQTKMRTRKPLPQHWHNMGLGSAEAEIAFTINGPKKQIAVEVYIPDNKALFDCLLQKKNAIENALGMKLDWQPLPGKKASRIKIAREGDYTRKANWSEYHGWMLEAAVAFKDIFGPYVRECVAVLADRPSEE